MKKLMTRHFAKWAKSQSVLNTVLANILNDLENGIYKVSLGGNVFKERISFPGRGKSGSGRAIIYYKPTHMAIFVYGFSKNEKTTIDLAELRGFKEDAKKLLMITDSELEIAIKNGDFIEVTL